MDTLDMHNHLYHKNVCYLAFSLFMVQIERDLSSGHLVTNEEMSKYQKVNLYHSIDLLVSSCKSSQGEPPTK